MVNNWLQPGAGLFAAVTLLAATSTQGTEPLVPKLEFIGMQILATGSAVDGVPISELSAITYDSAADRFLAINDSPGPGAAYLFKFDLRYDYDRFDAAIPLNARQLRGEDGLALPNIDAEGLSRGPDGTLYLATEGRSGTTAADSRDPAVWAFDEVSLRRISALPIPEKFLPRDSDGLPTAPGSGSQATGVQLNLGFEGVTISPDGNSLYVVNEAALLQDDERGRFDRELNQAQHSRSRILKFQRQNDGNWHPVAERIYRSDPGSSFIVGNRFNSVAELLAIDNGGNLLVLERGLIDNNLNTGSYRVRIYAVHFNQAGATDVSPLPSLNSLPRGTELKELDKFLVWDGSAGLDNIEGMTWGRPVNGHRSLVLISDNNSSRRQQTQLLAFATDLRE